MQSAKVAVRDASSSVRCYIAKYVSRFIRAPPAGPGVESSETVALQVPRGCRLGYSRDAETEELSTEHMPLDCKSQLAFQVAPQVVSLWLILPLRKIPRWVDPLQCMAVPRIPKAGAKPSHPTPSSPSDPIRCSGLARPLILWTAHSGLFQVVFFNDISFSIFSLLFICSVPDCIQQTQDRTPY